MKKLSRRDSLENEMHAMNLNHENVTKIREVFDDIKEDQNSAILVLEYVVSSIHKYERFPIKL